ncbi:extensin [Iris pallida]|uniref:Extensin n=1 Tax=Iris pallida TaxID=29817 RepID=A0AAX6H4M9_IRIPA|nr:extensin [Iris pallida]
MAGAAAGNGRRWVIAVACWLIGVVGVVMSRVGGWAWSVGSRGVAEVLVVARPMVACQGVVENCPGCGMDVWWCCCSSCRGGRPEWEGSGCCQRDW